MAHVHAPLPPSQHVRASPAHLPCGAPAAPCVYRLLYLQEDNEQYIIVRESDVLAQLA
jgi:hypothetical protein